MAREKETANSQPTVITVIVIVYPAPKLKTRGTAAPHLIHLGASFGLRKSSLKLLGSLNST